MDTITRNQWRQLAEASPGHCVSIYMPTSPGGAGGEQDVVRLKNLLDRAEAELISHGMRSSDARDMLQAARALPESKEYWRNRSRGLALFVAPQQLLSFRVPVEFSERLRVGKRYETKSLAPAIDKGERFMLLALSQNRVRLFEVQRRHIEERQVEGLPENMETALNYVGTGGALQSHAGARGGEGAAAIFHGQGGVKDAAKIDLAEYFRIIDRAVWPVLRDARAPLLLAGVDYLLPIYRSLSSYHELVDHGLIGNCDYLAPHELLDRAWPLMEEHFAAPRRSAKEKFAELAGTGKASDNPGEVAVAAANGRVESLFVDPTREVWGSLDRQSGAFQVHDKASPHAEDLVDLATTETLLHAGEVYAAEGAELPGDSPVAAVFRY